MVRVRVRNRAKVRVRVRAMVRVRVRNQVMVRVRVRVGANLVTHAVPLLLGMRRRLSLYGLATAGGGV